MSSEIEIRMALSGPLPAKQAATLATTATSIADDKLANQLSKWWDIVSYAPNCDLTGHSKEEQQRSRHWSKQLDSQVKDTRLDFYGEKRK